MANIKPVSGDLYEMIMATPSLPSDLLESLLYQSDKIARKVFEGAIEQLKDVIINAAVNKIKPTADSAVKHRLKVEVGVPADLWRNVMTYIPVDVKAVDVPTATFMEKSMRENNENFVENPLTDILP